MDDFFKPKNILFEKGNALVLAKTNYNIDTFIKINKHSNKTKKV